MHKKIERAVFSFVLILGLATAAHADTVYTFTRSTTLNDKVTASGSITANQAGTNLSPSVITDWNIQFSGGGFTNLTLNSSNSSFTFQPGTVIDAALDLSITAPTKNAGFTLSGNAQDGSDTFEVQWVFGNGPAELMAISVPGGNFLVDGANLLTYPSTFTTNSVGAIPAVPEPSSLLLLGTGTISIGVAGLRRLRSAAARG